MDLFAGWNWTEAVEMALIGLVGSLLTYIAMRSKNNAEAAKMLAEAKSIAGKVVAEAKKTDAEAEKTLAEAKSIEAETDKSLSAEWREMYDRLENKLTDYEQRATEQRMTREHEKHQAIAREAELLKQVEELTRRVYSLENCQKELAALRAENADMRKKQANADTELHTLRSEYEAKMEVLEQENVTLRSKLDAANAELAELRKKIDVLIASDKKKTGELGKPSAS